MARKRIVHLVTFKDRLTSGYRAVESLKQTHQWLLENLCTYVWKHEDYKRLTQYERGVLEGMRIVLENNMREKQFHAYDMGDGKPVQFKEWRENNPDANPAKFFRATDTEDGPANGHFYWTGTNIRFY